jgi:hypothetical protein
VGKLDNSNRPDLRAYIGATGSGKGVSIREHLAAQRPGRLLVWDPLHEYGEFAQPVRDLAALANGAKAGAFALAYSPGPDPTAYRDKFAMFCRIAFAAGKLTMLVEELADVTSPSFAPLEWRRCTTQGRHKGLRIIAASQRPAQVDKQFLGGCTYIRCFTLRYPADRQAMAGAMSVPLAQVAELQTVEHGRTTTIAYVERDFRTGKTTAGTIEKRR